MLRLLKITVACEGLVGLAMLAGCADLQDTVDQIAGGISEPRSMAFACADDQDFRARFSSDREEAQVDTGNKSYDLKYSDRDNGMRVYSDKDDEVRLSVGHDEAYLRVPGASDYKDCERT